MKTTKRKLAGWLCAAGTWMAATQAGADVIQVTSDVTVDTGWTADNTYVLTKPIFVRDGATLTISAGTLIRGEKELNTDPGALIVSRGSKIRAMGTAAQPIVMTDMSDNHFVGPSPVAGTAPYSTMNNGLTRKWGGLLLLGRTYLATNIGGAGTPSPNASLELQIEGLEPYGTYSKYGGGDDDDDSGEIHYVSIRYGGFVLGDANEINGLTMGGVGRETEIDHVEVFQNKDDGFEWFGGTVNTKYLVAWCAADDSFDWDEGFRGKGQFWMAVQGPLASEGDVSDKGAECDGGMGDSSQPSSCPTVYNATFVGTGKASGNLKNAALHFRDGTGGRFYNSLLMDFGGACMLLEGDPSTGTYEAADHWDNDYVPSAYYTHTDEGRFLDVNHNAFWSFGSNGAFACIANTTGIAGTWGAEHKPTDTPPKLDGNKPHFGYPLFGGSDPSNALSTAAQAPVTDLIRAAAGVGVGGKTYYPVEYLDPSLPLASPYRSSPVAAPADGFYSPVSFVGAFGSRNWANDWTLAYNLGLLYSAVGGSYEDFEIPVITDAYTTFSIVFPTTLGSEYRVEASPSIDQPDWDVIDTVIGDGTTNVVTDIRPMSPSRVYRVTTNYNP